MQSESTSNTMISVEAPTPLWVRKVVRALTWITALYALVSINVNLADFGVSEQTEMLILKYAASFTGIVSVVARFVGVKPPELK